MKRKPLPIGIDDFKKLIEGNYYFVDKSLFIKEIIDAAAEVILLLRPRRFGKTINLSMLRYFFESSSENTADLFQDLAIAAEDPTYLAQQAQYPVIHLTFKEIKDLNWPGALSALKHLIANLFRQHRYLVESDKFASDEIQFFQQIIDLSADNESYATSLLRLSEFLSRYHDQRVMILIDEYDTPIHSSYMHDYAPEMLSFMRKLFGSALKGNPYLARGIITGILQIARESLFSGVNNLIVHSSLSRRFVQHFGLLEAEVKQALQDYQLSTKIDDIRKWYNGYNFGEQTNIYNPWSIMRYIDAGGSSFQPYWVNTADTSLIAKALAHADYSVKKDIETLLSGLPITKEIKDTIILQDVDRDPAALWSLLLLSGYLTASSEQQLERPNFNIAIPNREVHQAYTDVIKSWFSQATSSNYLADLTQYLTQGDMISFSQIFKTYLEQALSYFDVTGKHPESFYHALVLGMLVHLRGKYTVTSNRESGFGRYDVLLSPNDPTERGIIIEFKVAQNHKEDALTKAAKSALQQIAEKNYQQTLLDQGTKQITALGIAFSGKQVTILAQDLST